MNCICEGLKANKWLKSLFLGSQFFFSQSVYCLISNAISVIDNNIGDLGARYLADALTKNGTLTKLYLGLYPFGGTYNNRA